MSLSNVVPQDDILLCQLTAAKLVGVAYGILSVGVGSLEFDPPTDFLEDNDKVLPGFLEVFRHIGVKPGHADTIELLREQVRELSNLAIQYHANFMELARWRTMSSVEIQETANRLATSYTQFLQALGAFCSGLGIGLDCSVRIQQGRNRIDEFVGLRC
jgi:hypothetical protein